MKNQKFLKLENKINKALLENKKEIILEIIQNGELNKYLEYLLRKVRDEKLRYYNLEKAWEIIRQVENILEKEPISELESFFKDFKEEYLYRKAVLLYEHIRDYNQAKKLFKQLIQKNSKFKKNSLYYLCLINLETGNINEAKKYFEQLDQILQSLDLDDKEFPIIQNLVENLRREFNRFRKEYVLITNENKENPAEVYHVFEEDLKEKYELFVNFETSQIYFKEKYICELPIEKLEVILCMAVSDTVCTRKNYGKYLIKEEGITRYAVSKRIKRLKEYLGKYGISFNNFQIQNTYCIVVPKKYFSIFKQTLQAV